MRARTAWRTRAGDPQQRWYGLEFFMPQLLRRSRKQPLEATKLHHPRPAASVSEVTDTEEERRAGHADSIRQRKRAASFHTYTVPGIHGPRGPGHSWHRANPLPHAHTPVFVLSRTSSPSCENGDAPGEGVRGRWAGVWGQDVVAAAGTQPVGHRRSTVHGGNPRLCLSRSSSAVSPPGPPTHKSEAHTLHTYAPRLLCQGV